MVFILITPSLAVGYEWVFGLRDMWVHSHQACLPTLADATQKLMLLADKDPNWPYAYEHMNVTVAHLPLSSDRHSGIMTDGIPSVQIPAVTWTNCRCRNYCNVGAGWFALRG